MDVELSRPLDLVVVALNASSMRCRMIGTGRDVTLHAHGEAVVPGEVLTVSGNRTWSLGGHIHLAGHSEGSRLDAAALGLPPLALRLAFDWDPNQESWLDDGEAPGERIPEWAEPIMRRGPRPAYEMEQVRPGTAPADPDEDAIDDACALKEAGALAAARAVLMGVLTEDLRCLDAHAQLGNFEFDARPEQALRHYRVGAAIGDLALGADFDGVLPWLLTDNRPFLRCLHGAALCLWRLGRNADAAKIFERLLWLNPADNQGERFNMDALRQALTWDEVQHRRLH